MLGFNDTSTLWVILCRLPEKGRKEIEEIVEEMKETIREEIGLELGRYYVQKGQTESQTV